MTVERDLDALLPSAMGALVGEDAGAHFGVAVSGGPDSMALLDLAARAFPGRVAAATVDHGLRPEAADEAAMVARWCAGHGIAHAILYPDSPVSGNVQAWARAQRYALLARWRVAQGIDWIMTAHHADDQLETLLMRLNRGSGVGGLAGVRGRSGAVVRPLLGVGKAELEAYARAAGLPHVHDPSNSDLRYDRAAMRAALAQVDWIDSQAAARSAAALAEADAALEWAVDGLATRHARMDGEGNWTIDPADLPREVLRRLLLRVWRQADASATAPRGETLDRAIAAAQAGGQANLGAWLLRGGALWTLSRAPARRG